MAETKLPSWVDAALAVHEGRASALEMFIEENEPAIPDARDFGNESSWGGINDCEE